MLHAVFVGLQHFEVRFPQDLVLMDVIWDCSLQFPQDLVLMSLIWLRLLPQVSHHGLRAAWSGHAVPTVSGSAEPHLGSPFPSGVPLRPPCCSV